jgi:ribose-phosphate pyrophosphokinase
MTTLDFLLFALGPDRHYGERLAERLGHPLDAHEEREFEGGEHKTRPLVEAAGRDAFVVQSLAAGAGYSCNDKLIRLLFFVAALKDAGAARVTALVPYLAYSRKDRRTKPRDPVSSRYVAALFEAVRTDCLVTLEVHNISAFENAFRSCRPEHVPTARLFAGDIARRIGAGPAAVVSPDTGGDKRAELFRHELEQSLGRPVTKGIMEKHRSMGVVSGSLFAGDVAGRTAVIIDDLISSGGTILRAAQACRTAGATRVLAAAIHGMFSGNFHALFGPEGPDELVISDTVPLASDFPEEYRRKLAIVESASLAADVIERLRTGGAVSDILPYI